MRYSMKLALLLSSVAIAAAKNSLDLAKKAGNKDYIALNEKSLKEWGAM